MKKCRYCAEEIRDEAVICRFCGRPQADEPAPAAAPVAMPARKPLVSLAAIAGVVALAALVALVLALRGRRAHAPLGPGGVDTVALHDSVRSLRDSFPAFADLPELEVYDPKPALPPPPPPPPPAPDPPATGDVAEFDEQKIEPRGYLYYLFELSDARPCRLRGRVETTAGGSHDLDVLVLDADGWANFRYNRRARPVFEERRTAAVTLDVPLRQGSWFLVLSNRFSGFTSKIVRAENIHWICSGELPADEPADSSSSDEDEG